MISQEKHPPACLICGGTRRLAREGEICLCEACLRALSGALGDKLLAEPFPRAEPAPGGCGAAAT